MEVGSTMRNKVNLIVLRHGHDESTLSDKKVHPFPNTPLSDLGRKTISASSETLLHEEIEVVLSSPLLRAFQSSEIIRKKLGVPIYIVDELKEWKPPSNVYGKSSAEYTEEYLHWKNIRHKKPNSFIEDGESMTQIKHRIKAGQKIIKHHFNNYNKILVVSHLIYLRGLLGFIFNKKFNNGIHLFEPNNLIHIMYSEFIKVIL